MILFRGFLLFVLLLTCSCGHTDRSSANDTLNDSLADKTPPHKLDSLSMRRYAGVFAFGNDAEKEAVGTLLVYPESDSTVLFHIDISKGPPSYNSGSHTGSITIKNDTALETYYLDTLGAGCKMRFMFTASGVTIKTIPGYYDCGFGHGVMADQTYKRISDTIPEFFFTGEGDSSRFDRITR